MGEETRTDTHIVDLVDALDRLDAPHDVSRLEARLLLARAGVRPNTVDLARAIRLRRQRPPDKPIGTPDAFDL